MRSIMQTSPDGTQIAQLAFWPSRGVGGKGIRSKIDQIVSSECFLAGYSVWISFAERADTAYPCDTRRGGIKRLRIAHPVS